MTQEDKGILLKDLSARLPYGVVCDVGLEHPLPLQRLLVDRLDGILLDFYEDGQDYQVYLSEVKPYLFPFSSMTEEQKKELKTILGSTPSFDNKNELFYDMWGQSEVYLSDVLRAIELFNKHHFDYNGLISRGLAIDCTNLNIY